VHLGMWTVAFDASGKENDPKTPCFVVAGFVGTAERWIEFEPEWKRRLGALPYWGTAEMRQKYPSILNSLVEMLPAYAIRKFACGMNLSTLKSVPDDIKKNFLLHAYPLCGRTIATYVELWAMKETSITRDKIEYVFEEGDEPKGFLMRLMKEDGYPSPIFRYKKDCIIKGRPQKGFVPLQAADILAWHVYQIHKEFALNPQRSREDIYKLARLPFAELENMPELPLTITDQDLEYYVSTRTYVDARRLAASQGNDPVDIQSL
jgi:hypothetical protein